MTMKLDRLIQILEQYKNEHGGNLDVYVNHMDSLELFNVEVIMPPDKRNRLTICFSSICDRLRR